MQRPGHKAQRNCINALLGLQGENELEEDLLDQVQNCLGAVLEQFGDDAMPLLEGLMPQISILLMPNSSTEEKRVGICIMDDILEHSEQGKLFLPSGSYYESSTTHSASRKLIGRCSVNPCHSCLPSQASLCYVAIHAHGY